MYHVFLRHLTPRHPPCALFRFLNQRVIRRCWHSRSRFITFISFISSQKPLKLKSYRVLSRYFFYFSHWYFDYSSVKLHIYLNDRLERLINTPPIAEHQLTLIHTDWSCILSPGKLHFPIKKARQSCRASSNKRALIVINCYTILRPDKSFAKWNLILFFMV